MSLKHWSKRAGPGIKQQILNTSVAAGKPRQIYMDFQATTPMDPRVLDKMMPYFLDKWGNPASRLHEYGEEAKAAVEEARKKIAELIGARKDEIVFTSGATESGNLAIKGLARFHRNEKKHIVTAQTEHKCILNTCRDLEREGYDVTYLKVDANGKISLAELEKSIRPDTLLVSVMHVNNETGVIQPIAEIGKMCKARGVYFHTDAAQSAGKIPIDVDAVRADMVSLSSHKMYGPKGIGALYVRKTPRVRLEPLISGGGQERGMRSGTLATPLIVGFGEACSIARHGMEHDAEHVRRMSERFVRGVSEEISDIVVNGDDTYPGCVNISFRHVEGESILLGLEDFAVSSGSACTSESLEPSYVLRALGREAELAHSSIRFGIGRFTTEEEIDLCVSKLAEKIRGLREMSPLWESAQFENHR
ncbi:MAG: cysteine desulfurase [Amphiamblys sp. WSBS2006]|nr:MAG: cysteine desulfurase [Amphiamblys sp. WSBS2006]